MRATVMYGAGDVRVVDVPDRGLRERALVRVPQVQGTPVEVTVGEGAPQAHREITVLRQP